jgi:hypothetical protein
VKIGENLINLLAIRNLENAELRNSAVNARHPEDPFVQLNERQLVNMQVFSASISAAIKSASVKTCLFSGHIPATLNPLVASFLVWHFKSALPSSSARSNCVTALLFILNQVLISSL